MVKNKYAIIILAAGGSQRLGQPKQLLKRDESTLLNYTIEQASYSEEIDVFVALGGNQSVIQPTIAKEIPILVNDNWKDGIGSSISNSLKKIDLEGYHGIIISVCDQPYISSKIFADLIFAFENVGSSIIISKYKIANGPPSLFGKKHYPSLLTLSGDNGAKEIVKQNLNEVGYVLFEEGDIDIDTVSDLELLSKQQFKR